MTAELPPTRQCTICGESKPDDDFYVKDKRTGRRYSWCKPCHNARTTADINRRRAGLPPPPRPVVEPATERDCRVCGQTKPIDRFRVHRRTCRDCEVASQRQYNADHPDRVAETQRAHRERHTETLRQRARDRYATDSRYGIEKQRQWRAENPDRVRSYVKSWKTRNPDYNAITLARRKARLLGAGGVVTVQEWADLKAQYAHQCLACRKYEPEISLTIDHVKPLALGGANVIANIQPLCQPCNSRKNAREIDYRP